MGGGDVRGDRRAMERRYREGSAEHERERRRIERRLAASSYVPSGEKFSSWEAARNVLNGRHPTLRSKEYSYRIQPPYQATIVVRYEKPDGSKLFHVMTKFRDGFYLDFPDVPYRLYCLDRVTSITSTVFVCEGERAADALFDIGLPAITSLGGPGKAALTDWTPLRGKDVIILPDLDQKGSDHADEVAQLCLIAGAKSVKIVPLPGIDDGEGPVEWIGGRYRGGDRPVLCSELNVLAASTAFVERQQIPSLTGVLSPTLSHLSISGIKGKQLEWIWPGVIPRGKLTLLAGELGIGKSMAVADIIARQTRGHLFPNSAVGIEAMPGNVLLFAAEDGIADTIVPRLTAAGADVEKVFLVDGLEESRHGDDEHEPWSFRLDRDLPLLKRELKSLREHGIAINLVVIDPISSYQPHADSSDNAEMTRAVPRLAELASQLDAAILVVSHGHRAASASRDFELSANRALVAAARSIWMVIRDVDNSKRRLLLPIKSNLCEEPPGFAFSIQNGRVCWEQECVQLTAADFLTRPTSGMGKLVRDGYGFELPRAIEWLKQKLTTDQVRADFVRRDAEMNDISAMTLRRAFVRLGAKAERRIGCAHWYWRLPRTEAAPKTCESVSNQVGQGGH